MSERLHAQRPVSRTRPSREEWPLTDAARNLRSCGHEPTVSKGCFGAFRTCQTGELRAGVEFVVRLHYDMAMKDAVIPQVRVETELRASLDAVLRPGETLTDFVEVAVRNAVEYRRVQTDFASRCDASLAAFERTGVSAPAAQVIAKLESKLAKRRKQLGG